MNWFQRIYNALLGRTQDASPAKTKSIVIKKMGLVKASGSGDGKTFETPDFNFEDILKAYNSECYVRQGIDKYVDLIFKAGWTYDSKNTKSVEYINMRLALMEHLTQTPTEQFFIEIAEDLVKYANVFIVKSREKNIPSIPGLKMAPIDGKTPIAGYFLLNPLTVTIARDKNNTIKSYKQKVGQFEAVYKPEDVIHIYYKRERGNVFGTPFLIAVMDDIKVLRDAEENVLRLIYNNIFPLYIYKVGLAEVGFEATDEEIEEVREQISNMPLDGGLVIPERHNVNIIGSEGEALDCYNYLKYFEQRVFSGLGVSEVQFGRGDTSNRSTADALTTEMHDRVKAYQSIMGTFISKFMFAELLLEGGFDIISKPEDAVSFDFNEIELESKIKAETHAIFKYEHSAITEDEMRYELGLEPVTDDGKMYLARVAIPKAEAGKNTEDKGADNKNQPENQHGKATGPKKKTEFLESTENISVHDYEKALSHYWELTKEDIVNLVKTYYQTGQREARDFDVKEVTTILHLSKEQMNSFSKKYTRSAFLTGIEECRTHTGWEKTPEMATAFFLRRLSDENKASIEKLMNKLSLLLSKTIKNSPNKDELVNQTYGVFKALDYRIKAIAKNELAKAHNYGYAVCAKRLGRETVEILTEEGCNTCTDKSEIALTGDLYKIVPPLHTNCACKIKIKE